MAPDQAPRRDLLAVACLAEVERRREETRKRAAVSPDPWSPWWRSDGWRLNAAGVILFAPAPFLCGDERLQMRRSWKDEALQRFDAQVLDARGRVLLTVNFLEFIRPADDSAHAETEA